MKKDYYPLEEVAKGRPYTVNDLLHFGETGRLKMCVVLPPTIVEITRLTPINELDENSKWAKLINEPHEDSEQAKGEDPPEFIHETIKMDEIAGPYHLFAGDVISIRKGGKGEGIEFVHDGNFDTNKRRYRFLNDNTRRTKKKFDITDLVITHEEKIRFEKEHVPKKKSVPKKEMGTEERENLLRLIGAFIEKYYQGKAYRKNDNSPNADAISKEFHGWLIDNDFSDKGIADKSFRNLIPKAYDLIIENKKENPASNIKLKKILPS